MFEWLFDTDNYFPRATCGNWSPETITLAITGDILIALAYFSIPVYLWYLWYRTRKMIPFGFMLFHFGLFIVLCGCTHVLDACMYVWPAYNFKSIIDLLTGLVSLSVLIQLPKAVHYFLEWKTPGEYRQLVEILDKELENEREMVTDMSNMIRLLEARISRLDGELKHRGWVDEQTLELNELQEQLDQLKEKYMESMPKEVKP